jgi:hypothetical protein
VSKTKIPANVGTKAEQKPHRLEETGTTCVPVLVVGGSAAKSTIVRDDSSTRDPTATTARLRALSVEILANRERAAGMQTGAAMKRQRSANPASPLDMTLDLAESNATVERSAIRELEEKHRRLIAEESLQPRESLRRLTGLCQADGDGNRADRR